MAAGHFTLAAATVDPGTEAFNPRPLIPYLASLGIPYHYLDTAIMDTAAGGAMKGDSICAFCARMKRGAWQILRTLFKPYWTSISP